jgi:hypothetical protein
MGGFTEIYLRDKSEENIAKHNEKLKEYGVRKSLRFYSEADIKFEFDGFMKGTGYFPDDQFPKDKIKTINDFKKYWNPKSLGTCFCPNVGSLTFDCYFGRTSKNAMRKLGRYIADHHRDIEQTRGSFSTFMERGMTKLERQIISESKILDNY